MLKGESFKCTKLEGFVKCPLEPKSKCIRNKLGLEHETSRILTS